MTTKQRKPRVNPNHRWLMDRGWVRAGQNVMGNRVQYLWSHPVITVGRSPLNTEMAITATMRRRSSVDGGNAEEIVKNASLEAGQPENGIDLEVPSTCVDVDRIADAFADVYGPAASKHPQTDEHLAGCPSCMMAHDKALPDA